MPITRRTALAAPALLSLPLAPVTPPPPTAVRQAEHHAAALGAALSALTRETGAEGWCFRMTEAWGPDPHLKNPLAGWGGLLTYPEAEPVGGRRFFTAAQPADLTLRDGALSIRWS